MWNFVGPTIELDSSRLSVLINRTHSRVTNSANGRWSSSMITKLEVELISCVAYIFVILALEGNEIEAAATKRLWWPILVVSRNSGICNGRENDKECLEPACETIWYAGCVHAIICESITYLPNFWSTDSKRSALLESRPITSLIVGDACSRIIIRRSLIIRSSTSINVHGRQSPSYSRGSVRREATNFPLQRFFPLSVSLA